MNDRRPRDLASTRNALLVAAQQLFAEHGYANVGVRDIADLAGADKALITRYFGSKERLFAAAVADRIDVRGLLSQDRAQFGATVVRHLLASQTEPSFKPTLALLRSVAAPGATELLQRALEDRFVTPLADWLGGSDAKLRATILTAQIAGLELMINVLPLASFSAVNVETLIAHLAPMLQAALESNQDSK